MSLELNVVHRVTKRLLLFFILLIILLRVMDIILSFKYIQGTVPLITGLIVYTIFFFLIKKNSRAGDIGVFIISLLIMINSGSDFFNMSLFQERIDIFLVRVCIVVTFCLSVINFINNTYTKKLMDSEKIGSNDSRLVSNDSNNFTGKILTIGLVMLIVLSVGFIPWKYRNVDIISHSQIHDHKSSKIHLQVKNITFIPAAYS